MIGVYPLFPDNTCRFLVFDFDNHEKDASKNDNANLDDLWKTEVDSLRSICKESGIDALTERSRSGRGAHVWIFFREPVDASLARNFGYALLDRGAGSINLTSFKFYDRMYPSQDLLSKLGNLVALPLQGKALENGNSAFVDESWNAYENQWDTLFHTKRLSKNEIEEYLAKWTIEITGHAQQPLNIITSARLKPWKRNDVFHKEDVTGSLHMVLADGLYVDALNLTPRLQNQIRCLATIDNPQFYKNKRMGRSNYYLFRTISLCSDSDGYIKIPRGLQELLIEKCNRSAIPYDIDDSRECGRPLRITFHGTLTPQQQLAAEALLQHDNGILDAATGFGKTVVSSYLIARRKTSTLILVDRVGLIPQWIEELTSFLTIDEPLPVYYTKKGRQKTRESVIGILKGGSDKTAGIIDIATVGSAFRKGKFYPNLHSYGMVIMDECHHAASDQAQQLLQNINAKYVYGMSATPMRNDNLEKINFMLLGNIRYKYSFKEQAEDHGIACLVCFRFTRTVYLSTDKLDIHKANDLICDDKDRSSMILSDVKECLQQGRTPVILTKRKSHAKYLHDQMLGIAEHIYLLYGDNSHKENQKIREQMLKIPDTESIALVATGDKIGEGFNFPRLDTLMLAAPVRFEGRLKQYVGRLNRTYQGKKDILIYDYVDSHIHFFNRQYRSRLASYRREGFRILSKETTDRQDAKFIYDSGHYIEVFEQDLMEAETGIVISSPALRRQKVDRTMALLKSRLETGIQVTVITQNPDLTDDGDSATAFELIRTMQAIGISVQIKDDFNECYAVIDQKLVWHGGVHLLGKETFYDNLIRIESPHAAAELLEMTAVGV